MKRLLLRRLKGQSEGRFPVARGFLSDLMVGCWLGHSLDLRTECDDWLANLIAFVAKISCCPVLGTVWSSKHPLNTQWWMPRLENIVSTTPLVCCLLVLRVLSLFLFPSFFFIHSIYMSTLAVFRHTRRGHWLSLDPYLLSPLSSPKPQFKTALYLPPGTRYVNQPVFEYPVTIVLFGNPLTFSSKYWDYWWELSFSASFCYWGSLIVQSRAALYTILVLRL